ncbi:MAG: polysaccharide deacetylase [Gammaproteobacteria bacterium]|nr:polysaccharide deacetylase [Gammaproteobacteria bacterium]
MRTEHVARGGVSAAILAGALFAAPLAAHEDEGTPHDQAIWTWAPEQIVDKVDEVRAGRDLTPKVWPDGARVAVSISFDFDTEPVWIGFQEQSSPSYMSRGEYGARVGIPRILKLLDKHAIPATFFVPAMTMELHPEATRLLRDHPRVEIGFHSYVHENPMRLTSVEERQVYARAMAIFEKHIGRKPVGFRSAAWDLTESTVSIVKEMGFLYESSMMADDRPYELKVNGKDTGLVELPVEWILDDWPLFQISWPAKHVAARNAEDVYSIWKDEFDVAYEEGTMYILTTHPQVIGHRYRAAMLDRLIAYMKSKPGVWFATHEEIARYVQAQAAP